MRTTKKGQFGGLGSLIMSIVFGLILIMAVAVPVVTQVIQNQAFTGINATVANLVPLFLILGGLALAATIVFGRR